MTELIRLLYASDTFILRVSINLCLFDNTIKGMLIAVLYHSLKFGAVVCLCRERTVDVVADNLNIVIGRILHSFSYLTFYRRFGLIVARIAGINYGSHYFCSSRKSLSTASLSLALAGDLGSKHISTNCCIFSSSKALGL